MKPENEQLVLHADRTAVTKDIAVGALVILIVLALFLLTVIPFDEFRSYSRETGWVTEMSGPGAIALKLAFGTVFLACLIAFAGHIVRSLSARKHLPAVYTFTRDGFTAHRTHKTYVWADFKKFFYLKGQLCLPARNKGGKMVVLTASHLSKDAYASMINHIKNYAPPELTADVKLPRHS